MSKILTKFRKLSSLAMCNSDIYTETFTVFNKRQKYFTEYTNSYVVNNKNEHVCVLSTGNICSVCKGEGIVFDNKSIIDFNYYKLCDNCKGKGYLP